MHLQLRLSASQNSGPLLRTTRASTAAKLLMCTRHMTLAKFSFVLKEEQCAGKKNQVNKKKKGGED